MREYNIDGHILTISDEELNGINLNNNRHKDCLEVISNYKKKYESYGSAYYNNGKTTIINVLENFVNDVQECSSQVVNCIISEARKHEIYDLTSSAFLDEYVFHSESDYAGLDKIKTKIDRIYKKMSDNHMQRQMDDASRGRIVGGGFGVSGAVKGMVTASVMNSVVDSYYDSKMKNAEAEDFTTTLKMLDDIKDSEETWDILQECICRYIFNVYNGYEELQKSWGVVCNASYDRKKCEALIESAISIPEKTREILLQALDVDPTCANVYNCLISIVSDRNGDLEKAALELANLDLRKFKLQFVESYLMMLDYGWIENYSNYKLTLKSFADEYALDTQKYVDCIEKIQNMQEECMHYVGDKRYDTLEDAKLVREDNARFCEYISKVDWNSEDSLFELLCWVNNEINSDLRDDYVKDIQSKIEEVSKNNRMVNGVLYEDVKEATIIRESYRQLIEIIKKDYRKIEDINDSKSLVEKISNEEVKEKAEEILLEIEKFFELTSEANVDMENALTRVELNKEFCDLRNLRWQALDFGVREEKFEKRYVDLLTYYLTVNGHMYLSMKEADEKYFDMLEKATKYSEYLKKQETQQQKKGFFSKITSGVNDVLQKTNENAYNWITNNGEKELPIISQDERIIMFESDERNYLSESLLVKEMRELETMDIDIKKIEIDNSEYIIPKRRVNNSDIIELLNDVCDYRIISEDNKDGEKECCYNISLSDGTYGVIVNNNAIAQIDNLNKMGKHNIEVHKFDSNLSVLIDSISNKTAKAVVDYLNQHKINADIVNMALLITEKDITQYQLVNYSYECEEIADYFVVLKYTSCNEIPSQASGLRCNYLLLKEKYRMYDNACSIANYGENYVCLGKYYTMSGAKEVCQKMIGKSFFSDVSELNTDMCEFKVLIDKTNTLSKRIEAKLSSNSSVSSHKEMDIVKNANDTSRDYSIDKVDENTREYKYKLGPHEETFPDALRAEIQELNDRINSGQISERQYYIEYYRLTDKYKIKF